MVQGRDEILNQSVEFATRDLHPRVRVFHIAARVGTWPTGRFTHLIYEHPCQARQVCPGELLIDPIILGHTIPEVSDDRSDCLDPA
jgi:hypothetical protein